MITITTFLTQLTIMFCLSHLSEGIFKKYGTIKLFTIQPFRLISEVFGCKSCASFWLSLAVYQNLFTACLIWTIIYLYSKTIGERIETTRL